MFNIFNKMNKISTYLIATFTALFLFLELVILILIQFDYQPGVMDLIISCNYSLIYPLVIIIFSFVVVLIKATTGLSREILLMYYGRQFYLKYQFIITFVLSSLSGVLIASYLYLNNLVSDFAEALDRYLYGLFKINELFLFSASAVCLLIICYYLIIYVYDIYNNTIDRYNSLGTRLAKSFFFVLRALAILIACFILYLTYTFLNIGYDNPVLNLISYYSNSAPTREFLVLIVVMLICLIVDYLYHFKKKVIV